MDDLSNFKDELNKKLFEFQQKLFGIDNLEDLKEEADTLISKLETTSTDIEDSIDEKESETETEEQSDDLDNQIANSEKAFSPKSNLLEEQEKLKRELGF